MRSPQVARRRPVAGASLAKTAAGRRGRPLSRLRPRGNERRATARLAEALRAKAALTLDSAEPGILVRWVSREPVGIEQTASGQVRTCGAGLCIRPPALLARSSFDFAHDALSAVEGRSTGHPATPVGGRGGGRWQTCAAAGRCRVAARSEPCEQRRHARTQRAPQAEARREAHGCPAGDTADFAQRSSGRRGALPAVSSGSRARAPRNGRLSASPAARASPTTTGGLPQYRMPKAMENSRGAW